ncbi:MAG TPA: hypothetical protein VFD92_13795 [Candidatus Binatia bacterium]|nr:hypothetical protein [Candidatus Binatia bacterium]
MLRNRTTATFVTALAVLALQAATAGAAGYCFHLRDGETVTVKSFRIPAKNKCKPFNGVELGGGAATAGMGCTNADESELILHYTSNDFSPTSRNRFDSATCRFPLPFPPVGPQQGECKGMLVVQTAGMAPYMNVYGELAYLGPCDQDVD